MSGASPSEAKLAEALAECERLREENHRLRERLGVAPAQSESSPAVAHVQAPAIDGITAKSSPDEKVKHFRSLFRGRDEVYADRWEDCRRRGKPEATRLTALPHQRGRRTRRSRHLQLNDLLGAVLREEPRPPLLVAGLEDTGMLAGTPWPHRWSNLPGWNRAAFTQWPLPAHWWFEAIQMMF